MTIAADAPTSQRRRRSAIYEQHLDELIRLLNAKELYGWEIWNYFAMKRQLSRRDVTDLIERAKADGWIGVSDFGRSVVSR
jgi:hypothetical protein